MSRLHMDSITKNFDSKKILQDIFLSCETGEIIGLLGRNGSGKSTLLQIIFGTIKGDTQFVKFNHEILTRQSDRKSKIAYLPQHSFLPKNSKIKALVPLFCSKINRRKILDLEIIKNILDEKPKNLSGGELKLIEILLIIFSDAEIILLDEPFSSLAPKAISQIKTLITELKPQKGFIISDHNYQDIIEISDRNLFLMNGNLKTVKDLTDLQRFNYLPKTI